MHHSRASGQHTPFRFTPHPLESGIDASAGTVGDALGNAPAESMIRFRKTRLIKPRSSWHTIQEADVTIAEYVDWHNNRRPRRARGSRPSGQVRDPARAGRPDQSSRLTPTTSLYRARGSSHTGVSVDQQNGDHHAHRPDPVVPRSWQTAGPITLASDTWPECLQPST
jgi:putative transposase